MRLTRRQLNNIILEVTRGPEKSDTFDLIDDKPGLRQRKPHEYAKVIDPDTQRKLSKMDPEHSDYLRDTLMDDPEGMSQTSRVTRAYSMKRAQILQTPGFAKLTKTRTPMIRQDTNDTSRSVLPRWGHTPTFKQLPMGWNDFSTMYYKHIAMELNLTSPYELIFYAHTSVDMDDRFNTSATTTEDFIATKNAFKADGDYVPAGTIIGEAQWIKGTLDITDGPLKGQVVDCILWIDSYNDIYFV